MAENQEESKRNEREIPVLAVLKNNCILKNIFLVVNPHSISAADSINQQSETEEILVVGRHRDCSIKLEHPSISRFHLRSHSIPYSRSLFVTDLSSEHGTCISGTRIEPGVMTQLNEGDMLNLGASSRLYRLNWVPLSSVGGLRIDKETEEAKMDQTLSDDMEGIDQLLSEDDLCQFGKGFINPQAHVSSAESQLETMEISEGDISVVNSEISKALTPNDENMTANSHLLRSAKVGKSETKEPKLYGSSPPKTADYGQNQHREVLQTADSASGSGHILKKQPAVLEEKADSDPLCPLPINSTSNHRAKPKPSVPEDKTKNSRPINYLELEEVNHSHHNITNVEKKQWVMVVDTCCLMNNKSRRELHLMRVVRELDCLLRRGSFFRRTTEVFAALQWIEDSVLVSKGWIHVQSSAEECRLIPATTPAAPSPWFFQGYDSLFSPYSLQEIITPTAADHILESALFFKRTSKNNAQVVILSDDVALKIKAMAEGIICEKEDEFRLSLVSPFSRRFLFAGSYPVGPSWFRADDVVVMEIFYRESSKKQFGNRKSSPKGLKLTLSQF